MIIINFIMGMFILYYILRNGFSDNPKFNYEAEEDLFTSTMSVLLYYIISIFIIMFFVTYWNKVMDKVLDICNFKYKFEIINSGLCFAVMIPLVGLCIHFLYRICCKVDKKQKYLYLLKGEESKWILILSCISLIIIGILAKQIDFLSSVTALLVGKFMWFDSYDNRQKTIDEMTSIIKLPVFVLFLILFILYISIIILFVNEQKVIIYVVSLCLGCVSGLILYVFRHQKK